jgi:tripartite-type tricarboxylate transporter receptor subunit TctC
MLRIEHDRDAFAKLRLVLLVALITGLPAAFGARAQTYPTRMVRSIVPFGPGSAADTNARMLADKLAVRWGKPVTGLQVAKMPTL